MRAVGPPCRSIHLIAPAGVSRNGRRARSIGSWYTRGPVRGPLDRSGLWVEGQPGFVRPPCFAPDPSACVLAEIGDVLRVRRSLFPERAALRRRVVLTEIGVRVS